MVSGKKRCPARSYPAWHDSRLRHRIEQSRQIRSTRRAVRSDGPPSSRYEAPRGQRRGHHPFRAAL